MNTETLCNSIAEYSPLREVNEEKYFRITCISKLRRSNSRNNR